jgi:hypothetical protein
MTWIVQGGENGLRLHDPRPVFKEFPRVPEGASSKVRGLLLRRHSCSVIEPIDLCLPPYLSLPVAVSV